jgi:hypothetical protein
LTNGPPGLTTWSSLPARLQKSLPAAHKTAGNPAGNLNHDSAAKGKGKAKAIANPDSGPDDDSDSDDEFQSVPMMNGTRNRYKGKGKAAVMDGFVDTEGEDLYS